MSKTIVVFNDTLEIQELFHDLLTDAGYEVLVRGFGTQDMLVVRDLKPDLVIADCVPLEGEKAGWQLIQKMKMTAETEHIPIIICSTSLRLIHELEGWLKGKDVVAIPKPFDTNDLLAAVEQQIGRPERVNVSDGSGPETPA